ncbi:MAG: glycosyltransferase family 2 protein [Chitinispirillaceae bacterium]|nr:glycosyltransferase family 2 protein [Chitinispirillaceae bacterium]
MTALFVFVFWASVIFVIYSYTVYPLLLSVFSHLFARPVKSQENYYPSVGVLVPCHNEEKVIRRKIENILSLDYPADRISVWVGSDASVDNSEKIVRDFLDPRVHLWIAEKRGGKTGVLNGLAPLIDAEILLFTDANTIHQKDCLKYMTAHYADPTVGGVAGHINHASAGEEEYGENFYRRFESHQKFLEGSLHSTISAFGGFYSIRKSLFKPIPQNSYSNDDVIIPMNVISQGYRIIYEPRSISEEENTGDTSQEYARRVRIGAGNFQAFFWLLRFLNPFKGWPSFCYVSHKVTRWFSPVALFTGYFSCGILAFTIDVSLYKMLFATGTIFIIAGLGSRVIPIRLTRHSFYFLIMNIALIAGLFRYVRGIKSAAWSRTERS